VFVYEPRKLPRVLSPKRYCGFWRRTRAKYKAALSLAYGAGLRAMEVVGLKVCDVDSKRMMIRVEQGKGRKTVLHAVAATARAAARLVPQVCHRHHRSSCRRLTISGCVLGGPSTIIDHCAIGLAKAGKAVSARSLRWPVVDAPAARQPTPSVFHRAPTVLDLVDQRFLPMGARLQPEIAAVTDCDRHPGPFDRGSRRSSCSP